jgi:hypothetical protein
MTSPRRIIIRNPVRSISFPCSRDGVSLGSLPSTLSLTRSCLRSSLLVMNHAQSNFTHLMCEMGRFRQR